MRFLCEQEQWWIRVTALATVAFLTAAIAVRADDKSRGMTVTFGPGVVNVAGVDSRHEIIAFGIGIGSHGHAALLRRDVKTSIDEDGDGKLTFDVRDIPVRSVWVIVDSKTGEYVVATPTGELPRALSVPVGAWRGNHAQVDVTTTYLEILVVRPGGGAWTLRSADGGTNDADGLSDRKVRFRLDRMEKLIGEEKGPTHAIPKDLLFAIDPQTLETFVSEAQ